MPTLVTGGNGWLPCHVVRRLARLGEPVVSYDLMPPDDLLRDFLGPLIDRVVFEPGDVTDNAPLRAVALHHGIDSIVHAAAITPRLDRERREPTRIVDVNLGGTLNALEVARALPTLRRFIHISSGAVWGDVPATAVLDEDSPANATTLYGVTKLAGERVALRYAELFDLPVVAARPANLYGPMERPTPGYAGATEPREILRVHYAGEEVRVSSLAGPYLDWTYVDDVAEGIACLWAAPTLPHRLYSLTAGRLYGIGDLLEAFSRHLPGFRYRLTPEAEANVVVSGDPPGPTPSNERMRRDFAWVPPTSFDDGMRAYLAWITAHGPQ
jgi:nucleoside-diphosphate-sugar epimerase